MGLNVKHVSVLQRTDKRYCAQHKCHALYFFNIALFQTLFYSGSNAFISYLSASGIDC